MSCPLCASGNTRKVWDRVYGDAAATVHHCPECKLEFLLPLLAEAEENKFYEREYAQILLERQGLQKLDMEKYFHSKDIEIYQRLNFLKPLLDKNMRVLEIGSSSGYLLNAIRPWVAACTGIEPDPAMREFAKLKGIPTCKNLLELQGQTYDLILHYYVLEHVQHPHQFIAAIKGLHARHGMTVFEIPHGGEALIRLYDCETYKNFAYQKAHRFYHSADSLKRLFPAPAYEITCHCLQRYDLSNHMHWLSTGKPGGTGKYKSAFSNALDEQYRRDLAQNWLGDSLCAVVKPQGL